MAKKQVEFCSYCEHCNRRKGGFKVGDVLICVDERRAPRNYDQLHAGEIYVVTDGSNVNLWGGVRVENPLYPAGNMRWMKERFVKIGQL